MKHTLLILLISLSITSCAGLNDYAKYPVYRKYEDVKKPEPTVIDKLESCTEKYISKLGVSPSEAYGICDSIYRSR